MFADSDCFCALYQAVLQNAFVAMSSTQESDICHADEEA